MLKVQKPIPTKSRRGNQFFIITDENCIVLELSTYLAIGTGITSTKDNPVPLQNMFVQGSLFPEPSTLCTRTGTHFPFYAKANIALPTGECLATLWIVTPVTDPATGCLKQYHWRGCEMYSDNMSGSFSLPPFDTFLQLFMVTAHNVYAARRELLLESLFLKIADNYPVMFCFCDANDSIQHANAGFLRFTATTPEAVKGYGWRQLIHSYQVHPTAPAKPLHTHQYAPAVRHYRMKNNAGGNMPVLEISVPWYDANALYAGTMYCLLTGSDHPATEAKPTNHNDLIEQVSDSIIATDLQLNISTWNRSAEKVYGFSAAEVMGKPLAQFVQYAYKDDTEENARKYLFDHGTWNGEVTFIRKDGTKFYLYALVSLIKNDSGKVTGIVSVNRNITEKKDIEEALRKSEARFRFISENTKDLICLNDDDGKFLYISPSVTTILGYDPDQLSGKKFCHFIHPEEKDLLLAALKQIPDAGSNVLEYRFRKSDGTYVWLETIVHNVLNPENNILNFQTSSRDITRRKLEDLAIRSKEAEFRTLAENAPTVIQRLDAGLCYTYCNGTFEQIFNIPCSYIIGKTPAEAGLSGRQLKEFIQAATAVFQSNTAACISMEVHKPDGSYVHLYTNIVPETDQNEEVKSIMVISSDITQIRNQEEELKAKEAELFTSNQRFVLAARATTDALWEINLQTSEVYLSDEFILNFGYTQEEIKKQPVSWFSEKLHPEEREAVINKLYRSLSMHEPFWKDEFRWRCKDGVYKYILNQASIFYDEANRPYRAIGAIKDITHRKTVEADLVMKDHLLSAVAIACNDLLVEPVLQKSIDKGLINIGKSAMVNRVILLQHLYNEQKNENYLRYLYEWFDEGYVPEAINPDLNYIPVAKVVDMIDDLKAGNTINTLVKDITNHFLRLSLLQYQVKSVLILPIFTHSALWGFIGLQQCSSERIWTSTEIDVLKIFTSSVAAAIELKEANKKLKDSEEKFKALFQSSLDIVFVVDKASKIRYVTPSIEKVLGYTDAFITDTNGLDYLHAHDIKKFKKAFKSIMADPEYQVLLNVRVKDTHGKWLWMEVKAVNKLQDPNILGIILSFRDVTERQRNKRILAEFSEMINGILNSITDGFAAVDRDFKVKLWNQVAEKLTLVKKEEILGKNLWDHFPALLDSTIHTELKKALYKNITGNFEQYARNLNRWFEATVYPYEEGLLVYFKDVTARKQQEQLLEIEKKVLEVNSDPLANLQYTIDYFLQNMRKVYAEAMGSVILMDDNKKNLHLLSAPGLPDEYAETINNLTIGSDAGGCGTAMYVKRMVFVSDLSTDPLWIRLKEVSASYGIMCCWSVPVLNAEEQVIACFDCYFLYVKTLTETDLNLIERMATLLKIIIENKKAEEKVRIINDRYILATRATNEAIWDWDVKTDTIYGGEELYNLLGHKNASKLTTYHFWEKQIHPDDREKVKNSIREFIDTKSPDLWTEEYRVKRADGNYAIFVNKGYLISDNKNNLLRMIGSIANVTDKRGQEKKHIKQEVDKQKLVAMAVIDAQENERAKIGKELHDNVNQVLSTAKLFLEVAKSNAKERNNLIKRSAEQISNAINEIRHISQSLVPPSISDLGLTESIHDLVENIAVTNTLKVEYNNVGDIENSINDNQKLMLFRIIQEQVNNVLKHAEARRLLIQLMVNAVEIELKITDDGKGFDPDTAKTKKGVGLFNIASRVELFNGTMKIMSSPGNGCSLIVKVVRIPK